jgi:hypothetical protein
MKAHIYYVEKENKWYGCNIKPDGTRIGDVGFGIGSTGLDLTMALVRNSKILPGLIWFAAVPACFIATKIDDCKILARYYADKLKKGKP